MIREARLLACIASLLAISACKDLTHVQTGYVDSRDACRERAENKIGTYDQPDSYPLSMKEKNTALLFLFCECMKEHDWNVVGCKDVKAPATAVATNATPAPTGVYTPPPGYALVPVAPVIPNVSPSAGSNALEPSAKDRVFFGYNSTVINPDGEETLTRQALWLKQHPDVKVLIEGHCDERGTREYNIALGDRRANAVKNHLQALGVSPDRMETISYGKERPDQLGADENALSQNRRSVTVIPKP